MVEKYMVEKFTVEEFMVEPHGEMSSAEKSMVGVKDSGVEMSCNHAKVMMGGGEKTMRTKEYSSQTKDDDYSDDYDKYHCYTEDMYDFRYYLAAPRILISIP